jgi:hypothetical protein
MIGDSKLSRVLASLLTIVLLLATLTFTAGWYEPSPVMAVGEKTSDFLPSDTTGYFSFNLLPGIVQSTQFNYFLSFFKDDILEIIDGFSGFAADYIDENNIAEIVGPELALATYDISGNPGIVFFVQVPSEQTSEDVLDLVLYIMDSVLDGSPSESYPGGGVTQVNRSVGGENKIEYYSSATDGGSGDGYVLGALGNITLADFQTLNTSVTNGAWAGSSLSSNVDFQYVQSNLPADRMGLGYLNASDLQNDIIDIAGPLEPYLIEMEGVYPPLAMLEEACAIVSSPSFDLIESYIPSYAGVSISSIDSGLQIDYYSPDDSFPIGSGISNLLSTAGFVTSDAQLYFSDVNLNSWWQTLRPMFEGNSSELHTLADALSDAGLDDYIGFDSSILADLALDPNLDANVFGWSTGEFAGAQLPYAGGIGYLLVFSVSDYAQAVDKIGNLSTALGNIGVTGVHYQFTDGNTSLILGWPAGIIADMLSKPRLSDNANFTSMRSLLLSSSRGLIYKDAGIPLLDIGASYYIGSAEGRIVFRVPAPGGGVGGVGGGHGGGGGAASVRNWEISVLGNYDAGDVNPYGKALDEFWVASPDHQIIVYIGKSTVMKDADGKRLDGIEINLCDSMPDPPSGYKGLAAYCFEPDGATFDPAIRVTMKFNPDEVAPGQTIVAAYYDKAAGQWQFIEGIIIADGQAVFNIDHFSTYGLLTPAVSATPAPASTATPAPTASGGLGAGAWAIIGIAILVILATIILFVLRVGWKS